MFACCLKIKQRLEFRRNTNMNVMCDIVSTTIHIKYVVPNCTSLTISKNKTKEKKKSKIHFKTNLFLEKALSKYRE